MRAAKKSVPVLLRPPNRGGCSRRKSAEALDVTRVPAHDGGAGLGALAGSSGAQASNRVRRDLDRGRRPDIGNRPGCSTSCSAPLDATGANFGGLHYFLRKGNRDEQ